MGSVAGEVLLACCAPSGQGAVRPAASGPPPQRLATAWSPAASPSKPESPLGQLLSASAPGPSAGAPSGARGPAGTLQTSGHRVT